MSIKDNSPRVSVLMASYNYARYLPHAIESVLAQTWEDWELVIVDDGSTDDSLSIAQTYAEKYPTGIRVFTHPGHTNRGQSATFNLALREARGQFIAFLAADDVWLPHLLEVLVPVLDAHPRVGVVYTQAWRIDENGEKIEGEIGRPLSNTSNAAASAIMYCPIPALSVLARRRCFDEAGGWDERIDVEDWQMWPCILANWDAIFLDGHLALYRVHGINHSRADRATWARRTIEVMTILHEKAHHLKGALAEPEGQLALLLHVADVAKEAPPGTASALIAQFVRSTHSLDKALRRRDDFLMWILYDHTTGQLSSEQRVSNMLDAITENRRDVRRMKQYILGQYYGVCCFDQYHRGVAQNLHSNIAKALMQNLGWLRNRGFLRLILWSYLPIRSWQ